MAFRLNVMHPLESGSGSGPVGLGLGDPQAKLSTRRTAGLL